MTPLPLERHRSGSRRDHIYTARSEFVLFFSYIFNTKTETVHICLGAELPQVPTPRKRGKRKPLPRRVTTSGLNPPSGREDRSIWS